MDQDIDFYDVLARSLMVGQMRSPITDPLNERNLVEHVVDGALALLSANKIKENTLGTQPLVFKTKATMSQVDEIISGERIKYMFYLLTNRLEEMSGFNVDEIKVRVVYGGKKLKGYVCIAVFYCMGKKIVAESGAESGAELATAFAAL